MSMSEPIDYEEAARKWEADVRRVEIQARRYEIARNAAYAMIRADQFPKSPLVLRNIALRSVEFADALITELQRPTADNTDEGSSDASD